MSTTPLNYWNQLHVHIEYRAQWTAQNAHLQAGVAAAYKNEYLSLWEKISLVFRRIIDAIVWFFTPTAVEKNIQGCILPSSETPIPKLQVQFDRWKTAEFDSRFTPYCLDLTTPDNQKLHAIFYARDDVGKWDLPTIVYFQGMRGYTIKSMRKLLELTSDENAPPYNVIVFDYRASGINRLFYGERRFDANALILDGETVVQAAIHKLHILEENVHFFGVSFGGAIATFVAHMHKGRLVNYNSFASLKETLNASPAIMQIFKRMILQKQETGCVWNCLNRISPSKSLSFLSWVAPFWGWDLEPRKVLSDLQPRILCVNHPLDMVITDSLAAYHALPVAIEGEKCAYRCTSEIIDSEKERIVDGIAIHKAPPKVLLTKEEGLPMMQKLSQFLFIQP